MAATDVNLRPTPRDSDVSHASLFLGNQLLQEVTAQIRQRGVVTVAFSASIRESQQPEEELTIATHPFLLCPCTSLRATSLRSTAREHGPGLSH